VKKLERNKAYARNYICQWSNGLQFEVDHNHEVTYKMSYAFDINPMPGPNEWPVDHDMNPIEPPIPKKQSCRPRKVRKRWANENEPNENVNVTRKEYDVCCGNCGQKGHIARSCRQPENSNRKKYAKRVRKLKLIVVIFFLFLYLITIIWFTIECYNYVIDVFVYIMWQGGSSETVTPLEQPKTQEQLVNNQGTSHRLQANWEERDKCGSLSYTRRNQRWASHQVYNGPTVVWIIF
jgi:hypothetical protein